MVKGLDALQRFFEWLVSDEFLHAMHNIAGREIKNLLDQGFELERDPWGRSWIPSKKRSGKTLFESGALKENTRVKADARGAFLRNDTLYGPTHQFGATIMPKKSNMLTFKIDGHWVSVPSVVIPKRQFFLNEDEPLPPMFEKAIIRAWAQYLESRWRFA